MDSHRAAFVAEAEDGITDLNNALLALEADPEDAEAMDDVFRVAHTLKGNAAAMGYEGVSDFGHALEDLLDAVRQGDREVTPELMDLLFEGVDTVEAMVSEIADTGDVSTDPSDLEGRLREMEEHGTVGGEDGDGDADSGTDASDADDADADGGDEDGGVNEASADEDPESSEDDAEDISVPELPDAAAALDDPVVYADVTIGEAAMAGVDAALVLQALDGQFGEYVTVPGPEALEDGEYDERFDVFVADADPGVVAEGLGALTQVESIATGLVEDGEDGEDVEHGEHGEDGEDGEDGDAVDDGSEAAVGVGGADDADDANESAKDDSSSNSKSDSNSGDEIKSIRVDVDQVDELYGLVEQLVTSRIKLRRELEATDAQSDTLDELDKLASSLQDTAMDMRLIPFSQVSDSFPRLVRDISRDLGKRIDFEIEGDDVELDRTILTEMRDPLVHVLRNAVDHGIETPRSARSPGKSRLDTSDSRPNASATTSSSRWPTTAGARSRPAPREGGRRGRQEPRGGRGDGERGGVRPRLPPRLLHRGGGDRRLRARRWDGRGPDDRPRPRRLRLSRE